MIGGGTSIMPRVAPTIWEFARADDGEYLKIIEAALRIYDRQEWLRVNRARARIKVLIDKIGPDEFRKQLDEELALDWVNERDFTPELFVHDEEANAPGPRPSQRHRPTATATSSTAGSRRTCSPSARTASRPRP